MSDWHPSIVGLLSGAMTKQIEGPERYLYDYWRRLLKNNKAIRGHVRRQNSANDLQSRFTRSSLPRCQAFAKTRYSRSVLINRLFMFNAAWYSDPQKFSKLSDGEHDCDRNRWVGRRENFEQGNAFASRRLWNQSKKTSRETAESGSCIGPAFCRPSRRPISRTRNPGFTREHENIASRYSICNTYPIDECIVLYSRASKVPRVPRGYRPS